MPDHKFEFTISGVELPEQLKQRISADIAVAVTSALIAHLPASLHGPVWAGGIGPINGGRLLLGAAAEKARGVALG